MKQLQKTILSQRLALTQTMRNALDVLHMDQARIIDKIEVERKRNPFLRVGNPEKFVAEIPTGSAATTPIDAAATETPKDGLLHQIGMLKLSPEDRELATELVYCLDDRGFLTDDPEEISGYLDTPAHRIRAVVTALQSLEPPGIFAWSLSDSFRIQLEAKNRFDPIIETLLGRLDLVGKQDLAAICDLCGVDQEDAEDMIADVRMLSPAPLGQSERQLTHIRKPDLIIVADDGDGFVAKLNPDALPDLLTDDALFSELKAAEADGAAAAYYKDCYQGASQLVRALQKRANTLLAIGNHIADIQARFIRTGREIDRIPLSMSQTASAIGLNKSTVSRALNGCSIETPHGVLEAAAFFVRQLNDNAENKTLDQALKRLNLLVKTEDRRHPLSDHALSELMAKSNFEISRRTVVKYRGMLGIPNSNRRKGGSVR